MSMPAGDLGSPVDRSGPAPLHHQLKAWLTNQILSGGLPRGARLPDEPEICERLGVRRAVVRRALAELAYEGLVDHHRGQGTFVSWPKTAEGLTSGLWGLTAEAALRGQSVSSRVLVLREVPATETVGRSLGLVPGGPVVELDRVRALDGEPHVVVVTYLPSVMVPGLVARDLSGPVSLYRALREDYDLPVLSSVRRVEATVAAAREARLLRVEMGAPLLVLRSVTYTTGARPLDYSIAMHRADRTAFEVELAVPADGASRMVEVSPVLLGGDGA